MRSLTETVRFMSRWRTNSGGRFTAKENSMSALPTDQHQPDLICLSHLRWNFVFQRPQHLMSRFTRQRRVFFIEEPIYDTSGPRLNTTVCAQTGVHVVTPHLCSEADSNRILEKLVADLLRTEYIRSKSATSFSSIRLL